MESRYECIRIASMRRKMCGASIVSRSKLARLEEAAQAEVGICRNDVS